MTPPLQEIGQRGDVLALWRAPFAEVRPTALVCEAGRRLTDMVMEMPGLPRDFLQRGVILIGGHEVERAHWRQVRPKAGQTVTFHYPLAQGGAGGRGGGGKRTVLSIIIAVAAIAATVFTLGGGFQTAFGIAALGKGLFATKLLAAGINLAASLATSALAASPVRQQESPERLAAARGAASASGNLLAAGAAIPRVVGTRKIFPPLACQPVTVRDGEDEYVEAVFVLAGPHALADIRVGDSAIGDAQDITYQVKEGWDSDEPIDLVARYGTTSAPGIELSTARMKDDSTTDIANQINPASDLSVWHAVSARHAADEIRLDLVFPEGLIKADDGGSLVVPFRIRMRPAGSSTWINLGEFHYARDEARELRPTVILRWGSDFEIVNQVPQEGWIGAYLVGFSQTAPYSPYFISNASFYAGSGGLFYAAGLEGSTGVRRVRMDTHALEIRLDPAVFTPGSWQIEIRRGVTLAGSLWDRTTYVYNGGFNDPFSYVLSGDVARIMQARSQFSDRVALLRSTAIVEQHPIKGGAAGPGLAIIAVRARNRTIENLSVQASGYVKDWDGSGWTSWTTTSNPVPHMVDVLRGSLTPDALPLDLLDGASFVDFRAACAADGRTCDMICEGEAIADLLNRMAGCGYGRLRMSETWGVMRDYDRSAEDPVQVFTSRNSSGLSMAKAFARLPDGFRAVYTDAAGDDQEVLVWREGREDIVNPRLEEVRYDGLTVEADVVERAAFDLKQGELRSAFWSFRAPAEAIVAQRGDLIAVNHDVIDRSHGSARIADVEIEDGNIVALNLDSALPVYDEPAIEDVTAIENVEAIELIGATSSIGIRRSDGSMSVHAVAGPTGSRDRIVLATPVAVANDDDGRPLIREDNLVFAGIPGREEMRLIVFGVSYDGDQVASITAVDEAPELWAA